jgi:hypothetical protein
MLFMVQIHLRMLLWKLNCSSLTCLSLIWMTWMMKTKMTSETHYYYVRRDFPDSADIVRKIRRMDYFWWSNGARCTNYALVRRSVSR